MPQSGMACNNGPSLTGAAKDGEIERRGAVPRRRLGKIAPRQNARKVPGAPRPRPHSAASALSSTASSSLTSSSADQPQPWPTVDRCLTTTPGALENEQITLSLGDDE